MIHAPDRRDGWSVNTIVSIGNDVRIPVRSANFAEWRILFYGRHGLPEQEIARFLRDHLRPGGIAIDVGANLGFHTLAMSRAVGSGEGGGVVVACEPNPRMYGKLVALLQLNDIRNVVAREVALAEAPGQLTFHVPRETAPNQGAGCLAEASPFLDGGEAITVHGTTLDALVDDLDITGVQLIKIDVEGFEAAVLAGARQCLERDRPVLVFEYLAALWSLSGSDLGVVLAELRELGYRSFAQIGRDGLAAIPDALPEFMNVVALSEATNHDRVAAEVRE